LHERPITVNASLLRILALIRKELLAILKDPRSRVVLFLPPIIQSLVFGYAASYDLTDVPYALVDRDRSGASQELVARFDGSGIFHRAADVHSGREAAALIDLRRVVLVLQIDQDFERRLSRGVQADIQVIADGRNSNTAAVALGYVGEIVSAFNDDWAAEKGQSGPSVRVVSRAWYNPNLESRWNMIPALVGTLTMLGTMILTALSVAREREQGTFDQLLVAPFRPGEIMVGKAVPSMMVGLAQATSILLIAQFWFRIPFVGSFATLYLGLGLFLMAAIGMGLLVSSLAATMQQAMLYSFTMIMPFTLLSGLTTPISSMPEWLQVATLINPLRFAIDIARRVYLEGADIPRLVPDLWPLALIGLFTLSFAAWLFRRRLG
jgi:ABC-2 type transport system permease protein